MRITDFFPQSIVDKFIDSFKYGISITDDSGIVIASYSDKNINLHSNAAALSIKEKRTIETEASQIGLNGEYESAIIIPLFFASEIVGSVIVEGETGKIGEMAEMVKFFIETIIGYDLLKEYNKRKILEEEKIIKNILDNKTTEDMSNIISLCHRMNIDLSLSRSIILIETARKENSNYFNINLNLGYDAIVENLKDELVREIKSNKYLTDQDIVGFFKDNQIVIAKAFLAVSDASRYFLALDKICSDIFSGLENNKVFTFSIAYGNVYSDFNELHKSYLEAQDIISTGKRVMQKSGFYRIDDMLMEYIGHALPGIIQDKMVLPILGKLRKSGGGIDFELLDTIEGFIDNCFSFSRTAQNLFLHRNTIAFRVDKFTKLTGLDPGTNIQHAFLTKILAVYVKLNREKLQTAELG